jgi:hypothetical protein
MTRKLIFAWVLIVLTALCALAQTPTPTLPNPPSLETILSEAEKQTQNYHETFKNLLADERKTFESYNKNGEVKNQTVVESTFLVYQSSKDAKVSSELRNVLRVDGKDLPDSQKRSEQLLAELQKATTLKRELEKIQNEGSRYDKTLEIGGLTLSEAVVLSERLRPYFDFKLLGTENLQGNDVYVVSYQQTRKSPYVLVNQKETDSDNLGFNFKLSVPGELKKSDAFLRGKLWIDAKTFQVWREERELTIQSPEPVVLLSTTLDYQASNYGILLPKQISLLTNQIKKNSNQYAAVRETKVNFDYSKFRKTEVDVKIIDDDQ